jgi:hypothetical protein
MAKRQRDPVWERQTRERVGVWSTSGLTVREFCRQQGVTEASFHFWKRELRDWDAVLSAWSVAANSITPQATPWTCSAREASFRPTKSFRIGSSCVASQRLADGQILLEQVVFRGKGEKSRLPFELLGPPPQPESVRPNTREPALLVIQHRRQR